jgi:hypothetical protein
MATGRGGGIYALASKVTLDSVHVDKCRGSRGAGLFAQESEVFITRSRWTNMTASFHGGGIYAYQGTNLEVRESTVKIPPQSRDVANFDTTVQRSFMYPQNTRPDPGNFHEFLMLMYMIFLLTA